MIGEDNGFEARQQPRSTICMNNIWYNLIPPRMRFAPNSVRVEKAPVYSSQAWLEFMMSDHAISLRLKQLGTHLFVSASLAWLSHLIWFTRDWVICPYELRPKSTSKELSEPIMKLAILLKKRNEYTLFNCIIKC